MDIIPGILPLSLEICPKSLTWQFSIHVNACTDRTIQHMQYCLIIINNNFEYLNWIDTSTYEKLLSMCVQYQCVSCWHYCSDFASRL